VWAVVSGLLEEAALVGLVLWGLPRLGVRMPLAGSIALLVSLMLAWGAGSFIFYRKGSRALEQEPLVGLPNMLGSRGQVVKRLAPQGLVKIRGELWTAEAESGEINNGEEVIVVGQEGLKLRVRGARVA